MGRREGALDPAAGPVQRFAYELRKLRQDAGGPTYRAMAQRAGYSVATLSRAATGENLPSLDVALSYARACGADEAEWEQRWRAVAQELAATPEPADDAQAPYRGLARFEPADAEMFFGRDELVAQLAERVHAHRLVAVVGASGSGKSSLLRAGLIPLLRSQAAPDRRPAAVRILTPGPRPMSAIATVMRASDERGDTVVLVDQFEELFTLCGDPAERQACLDRLLTATNPENKVRVVIAVRADFFGHCADHHAWAAALRGATLLVGPMSPTELRQAIVRPAAAAGLIVERDLTAQIIEHVIEKPGGLPLMSHALLETWRRRKGRTLTLTAYEAAGGVAGALAQTAEQLYTRLSPHEARSARHILLRLITPGEGTQDTCRPVPSEELDADGADDSTVTRAVLERLVRARLVTLDGQTVNLAHEALITAWPRLRGWIDEARERLRVHRRLTESARTWKALGEDPGALYRGTRLAAAEECFAGRRAELIPVECAFLDAGIAAREQEQRAAWRTARRFRRLHVAVLAVAVLAMTAGLVAWQRDQTAQQRLADAASRRAAALAESMRYADPLTALRLSVAAWRISPTLEARAALMGAATQPDQDVFADPRAAGKDASDPFFLSADGSTLVTGGTGRAQLWDLTTRRLLRALPVGKDDRLMDASTDARRLLFRASDTWEVRDAVSGAATRLPLHASDGAVLFGPDEDTFVVLDGELRFAGLWHLPPHHHVPVASQRPHRQPGTICTRTGDLLVWGGGSERRLARRGPWAPAVRLACGPHGAAAGRYPLHMDEEHLVIVAGNRIHIWSLRTGDEAQSLPATAPTCVSMTPDGRFLTVADDRALALWRLGSPARPVFQYPLQGRRVRGASLDPRRKLIRYIEGGFHTGPVIRSLSVGDALDSAWRTDAARKPPPATDPSYPVESQITAIDVAPGDGGRVATGDGTGWVTLWDRTYKHRFGLFDAVPADAEDGRPRAVSALAYSPDGRILAAAGGGTVRLWDVATSRPLGTSLLAAGDDVISLAFDHAGTTLIVHGAHTPPRAYPISPRLVAASVCTRAGSGLSPAAWKTLIPDVSYRQTC
ncbi:nSTAND1 domain-containing NTPase [Streptomyces puniciscabiei]|uniref:nSTAND1 domain-containing NTPase n=1 Tax=Streptomyces puniciscabiei TaxID=164348 RepID=UPI00332A8D4B